MSDFTRSKWNTICQNAANGTSDPSAFRKSVIKQLNLEGIDFSSVVVVVSLDEAFQSKIETGSGTVFHDSRVSAVHLSAEFYYYGYVAYPER